MAESSSSAGLRVPKRTKGRTDYDDQDIRALLAGCVTNFKTCEDDFIPTDHVVGAMLEVFEGMHSTTMKKKITDIGGKHWMEEAVPKAKQSSLKKEKDRVTEYKMVAVWRAERNKQFFYVPAGKRAASLDLCLLFSCSQTRMRLTVRYFCTIADTKSAPPTKAFVGNQKPISQVLCRGLPARSVVRSRRLRLPRSSFVGAKQDSVKRGEIGACECQMTSRRKPRA
jgi:hypothetical protein